MYTTVRGAEMAWQHQQSVGILTPPCEAGAAELAQLVEQLFRKQQVSGSSPEVGSTEIGVNTSKINRSGGDSPLRFVVV